MNLIEQLRVSLMGVLLSLLVNLSSQVDLTLEPQAKGYDVTQAVIRKIYSSAIFEDDYFFTHRVALISTDFGLDPKTYDDQNPSRGIWQLTQSQFNETKTNENLTDFRAQIQVKFPQLGKDWSSVSWEDLLRPLHNGLAFTLYIQQFYLLDVSGLTLPPWPTLTDQANHYKSIFNSSADPPLFIENILRFEGEGNCERGEMDIVFVQDGSCTLNDNNFTNTRQFITQLIDTFSFSYIRVGYVVYSSDVLQPFNLDNQLSQQQLHNAILNADRPARIYTATASGLESGLKMFESVSVKRLGVPQVLVVITDGQSIEDMDQITNSTLSAGLSTFSIGLSTGWNENELLAMAHNDPRHVSKSRFTSNLVPEFIYRMNMEICALPFISHLNSMRNGSTGYNQKSNYKFRFGETIENGVTIGLKVTGGQVRAYYSYSEQSPSSAIHDGELEIGKETFISKLDAFQFLYICVQGIDEDNHFQISVD